MEKNSTKSSHEDSYLMLGLRQSDPVAFKVIYRLHWAKLYNIAYYYVRSGPDAEDIVQDVFVSLWSRREQLELRGPLENYLVRCTKYTIFFYLKIKHQNALIRQNTSLVPLTNDTEEYISYKDLQSYILALFEVVSSKTKEIFFLSRFDGLTYPEIAVKLHISVKAVEYHISKALKMLADKEFQ